MSTTSCSTPVESVTRCCSKSPIIELLHWTLLVSFRNQSGGDWCGWQAATDDGCLAKSRGLDTVGLGVGCCRLILPAAKPWGGGPRPQGGVEGRRSGVIAPRSALRGATSTSLAAREDLIV